MVGLGRGARLGILVRSAEALERAEKLAVLAVDKTGTLTEGRMVLAALDPVRDLDADRLLRLAASLEQGSTHPLSRAIDEAARARGLPPLPVAGFENVPGFGVRGHVDGRALRLGSPDWLAPNGDGDEAGDAIRAVLADDAGPLGHLSFADRLRPSSRAAVARLRALGIRVVMLTGDRPASAAAIAAEVGIDDFRAGVRPGDKAAAIAQLKTGGGIVGMAGDGINDAPALASADVGFGMAGGSDIALETADITLMRADLDDVATAVELSRVVMARIRQNLFFAFFYNVLALPLAAAGLLSPVLAGAAMALSSVSVVTNSLRLKSWRPAADER
jgi:Cu+-exporting ATPase